MASKGWKRIEEVSEIDVLQVTNRSISEMTRMLLKATELITANVTYQYRLSLVFSLLNTKLNLAMK